MDQQPMYQNPQQPSNANSKKLLWAKICLIAPTLLFVLAIACVIVGNMVAPTSSGGGSDLFGETRQSSSIFNTLAFVFGLISFLTWLPGIIIGIILLVLRKK